MLICVMICYNDMPLIVEAIESVYDQVDRIVCVDGKYSEFPAVSDFSEDGTIEYLESLDKVELHFLAGTSQIAKRNSYLVGDPGDYYLMLDTDEQLVGTISIPSSDVGIVRMKDIGDPKYFDRVRLFKHVEGVHYDSKHYWLKDGDNNTLALLKRAGSAYSEERVDSFTINHHASRRSDLRKVIKRRYYALTAPIERAIQEVD